MNVPLRVGMLAPISWRVPPRHYGPWEQFVSLLSEGLVARGVRVTLFATADSQTRARLVGTAPTGYSEDTTLDAKVWECLHVATVFERAAEFDLIHNNADFLPLAWSRLVETPLVTTIHGFSSERIVPVYERYDDRVHYVAISDADRHPRLHYTATIHHGIERTGLPLLIAGIVQDRAYFEQQIEPRLDAGTIRYLGPVGPDRRGKLLGRARALVHLVNFEEPFGFSVVEAMACGTPVIARPRGSLPELVREGENGYLVGSLKEAAAAVEKAARLDRVAVRASVRHRFDADRMVDDYLALYRRIRAPLAHGSTEPAASRSSDSSRSTALRTAQTAAKSSALKAHTGHADPPVPSSERGRT